MWLHVRLKSRRNRITWMNASARRARPITAQAARAGASIQDAQHRSDAITNVRNRTTFNRESFNRATFMIRPRAAIMGIEAFMMARLVMTARIDTRASLTDDTVGIHIMICAMAAQIMKTCPPDKAATGRTSEASIMPAIITVVIITGRSADSTTSRTIAKRSAGGTIMIEHMKRAVKAMTIGLHPN